MLRHQEKCLLGIAGFTLSAVIAVYWPGLYGPFLLDDLQSITPAQLDHFSWRQLLLVSLENESGPIGRPLSIASFVLNHSLWGPSAFSYKAVNLVLHLVIGFLLGALGLLLCSPLPQFKAHRLSIGLTVGSLWLAHPLLASTVLYPVQRMTQLADLFIVIGLVSYLVGRLRLITHQRFAYLGMAFAFLIPFPLAVLSKETGLLFPWYLLAIEFFIVRFHCPTSREKKGLIVFHSLLSMSLLLGAIAYYISKLSIFMAIYAEKHIALSQRLLTEIKVLVFYLQLILLPRTSKMSLYHDDFPLVTQLDLGLMASAGLLGILISLMVYCRRKAPLLSFGIAWFFISHAIESTVIPLELVFEHRNYLASFGVLLIPCAYAIFYLSKITHTALQRGAWASMGMILGLCLMLTLDRSHHFASINNFLKEEALFHPNSPRMLIETANQLLLAHQPDQALQTLDRAQGLQPNNAGIALHQLLIYCSAQNVPPEVYKHAQAVLETSAITPYVILVFDQIVKNMMDDHCNAVDKDQLLSLLAIAKKNDYLWYKPRYKAVLYHLEAGLLLLKHQVNDSLTSLYQSFLAFPPRFSPLLEKATLEVQHHQWTQAEKTVEQLKRYHTAVHFPTDQVKMLEHLIQHKQGFKNENKHSEN